MLLFLLILLKPAMCLKSLSREILFEESALISNDLGIKQVVWEAIEIRLNNNILLNRDLGEYSLYAPYTNLIKNDLTKYYKKPININTEPKLWDQQAISKIGVKNMLLNLSLSFQWIASFHHNLFIIPCWTSLRQ